MSTLNLTAACRMYMPVGIGLLYDFYLCACMQPLNLHLRLSDIAVHWNYKTSAHHQFHRKDSTGTVLKIWKVIYIRLRVRNRSIEWQWHHDVIIFIHMVLCTKASYRMVWNRWNRCTEQLFEGKNRFVRNYEYYPKPTAPSVAVRCFTIRNKLMQIYYIQT